MCPTLRVRFGWPALLSLGAATPVCAQQLQSTPVVSGLIQPIGATAPAGDTHRLFVIERAGKIRVVRDGALLPAPFLDIVARVDHHGDGGFLGLAFHPEYSSNGRFFVSFIGGPQADPILREYRVSANPDLADPASGVDVLAHFPVHTQAHQHYGGDLQFGPDGMLYFTIGDIGAPALAQRISVYHGKLLRLNVDIPPPYVPLDNPYADPNDGGLDLVWARGLRNPWRFSFDRLTGDLYIGDVGEGDREEIDFQPANAGLPGSPGYQGGRDYGWPCMEGNACTTNPSCACDTTGATLALPVYETDHQGQFSAIIGGFAYRGSAIPGLQGQYFCADFIQNTITSFEVVQGQATHIQDRTAELDAGVTGGIASVASFGEDANGEIYLVCLYAGTILRIDPAVPSCTAPVAYCTTAPNSAGAGAVMGSTGSASIVEAELVLRADGAPARTIGAFLCGTQEIQVPFGNGWSCVGGNVVRLATLRTDAYGAARQPLDFTSIQVTPGQTRDFQFNYRDSAAGGSGFNFSDGLRVVFCP
jgi:glucose/arabinose dehydrogenase